ncbi:hypothetical protein NDU88_001481, partial [Pleurodeles waltl]
FGGSVESLKVFQGLAVPIFKKGGQSNPNCYRLIPLIGSSAQILAPVLLSRLEQWTMSNNILTDVQFSFRPDIGTIEQCLSLYLIEGKYVKAQKCSVHLAFIDLSS